MKTIIMESLSEKVLLEELQRRFDQNRQNIEQLKLLNRQLKEVNVRLEESEQLKTHFLSNVRNELINPMASIMHLSRGIAAAGDISQQEITKMASMIYEEAFSLNFQLNNIFAAAEIEAGENACEHYRIDVEELARSAISKFTGLAAAKGLKIKFENNLDRDQSFLYRSDPAKLQTIIENLLVNAITWSEARGEVIVSADFCQDGLQLRVRDFGKGIPDDLQERIFDRFKQLDMNIYTDNRGQGLGLCIVKSYVELLDGSVTVNSGKGRGTEIIICIPDAGDVESQGFSDNGQEFLFDNGEKF